MARAAAKDHLAWIRNNSEALEDDRERLSLDAAKELTDAQEKLVRYLMEREEKAAALDAVREQLTTLENEPELKDFYAERFAVRKILASLLSGTGQQDAAAKEVETGATALLQAARTNLANAWSEMAERLDQISEAQVSVGKFAAAVEADRQLISLLEVQSETTASEVDLDRRAEAYVGLTWHLLLAKRFAEVVAASRKGLEIQASEREKALISTNLAHGLLFLNRVGEARKVYETWKDKPIGEAENGGTKLFAEGIIDDFNKLQEAGFTHPAMASIHLDMEVVVKAQRQRQLASPPKL
jgi:hypothetical protein